MCRQHVVDLLLVDHLVHLPVLLNLSRLILLHDFVVLHFVVSDQFVVPCHLLPLLGCQRFLQIVSISVDIN